MMLLHYLVNSFFAIKIRLQTIYLTILSSSQSATHIYYRCYYKYTPYFFMIVQRVDNFYDLQSVMYFDKLTKKNDLDDVRVVQQ